MELKHAIELNGHDKFINPDDKDIWDNSYLVATSEFNSDLVYANNAQEALDEAIDYNEAQGHEGLFFQVGEFSDEFLEDYSSGGNHGRVLSSLNVNIIEII